MQAEGVKLERMKRNKGLNDGDHVLNRWEDGTDNRKHRADGKEEFQMVGDMRRTRGSKGGGQQLS